LKATKQALFPAVLLAALLFSACGGGQASNSDAVLTEAAQIAFQALTETAAAASPTPSPSPVPPTATATVAPPTATFTPVGTLPTATAQQQQQQQQGGGASAGTPCLRANLEIETVPDGTQFAVGTGFTKSWRLKNTGSCTWTPDFAVIWVQGDLMGAKSAAPFTTVDIPPGGYAMVEVPMVAPSEQGTFQGYWMLRGDGVIFGLGPKSLDWFWVKITTFDPNVD
jgi:hypothetical protein